MEANTEDVLTPKVENIQNTLNELIYTNKSICRYGDRWV